MHHRRRQHRPFGGQRGGPGGRAGGRAHRQPQAQHLPVHPHLPAGGAFAGRLAGVLDRLHAHTALHRHPGRHAHLPGAGVVHPGRQDHLALPDGVYPLFQQLHPRVGRRHPDGFHHRRRGDMRHVCGDAACYPRQQGKKRLPGGRGALAGGKAGAHPRGGDVGILAFGSGQGHPGDFDSAGRGGAGVQLLYLEHRAGALPVRNGRQRKDGQAFRREHKL